MITYSKADQKDILAIEALFKSQASESDSRKEIELCLMNYPSFIAKNGSKVVGVAYSLGIAKDILLLHSLLVDNDYRNKTIGCSLLTKIETAAKVAGYSSIALTNSMQYKGLIKRSAVSFYEKNGYSVVHTSETKVPTYLLVKAL